MRAERLMLMGFMFLLASLFVIEQARAEGKWITYKSGNDSVRAYLALPEGKGPHPALIVIHEWWGLVDWVTQNADEFARRGYVALAVDLYRGKTASTPEVAHELMRGVPEGRAIRDLHSAYGLLRSRSDVQKGKIGTIGWCWGGGYSLAASTQLKGLAACVVCYGSVLTEEKDIRSIVCPVLGIYGGQDRGIPAESVRQFEKEARAKGKNVSVTIYPDAGHAFMNPNNKEGFRKEDADNAWTRIYDFLGKNLQASAKKTK